MATIKKIVCPKCRAKLKFDLDKITSAEVKFKCPGCKTAIKIRKSSSDQKPSSSQTSSSQKAFEDTATPNVKSENLDQSEKPVRKEQIVIKDETAADPPIVESIGKSAENSLLSEKTAARTFDAGASQHDHEQTSPLPNEMFDAEADESEESLLGEYTYDQVALNEKGGAASEDYEWTRYTDKKESTIPKSTFDLDLIPVTDSALQETLADLQQAEVYNLQGESNLEKNLLKQALRDFNNALEINPDYVDALVNRGSAYVLQNRYEEALDDFNHALDLEKKQTEIYNLRGEIYLLNKLYDEAIKDFTAAIILNPTYSDAYLNRARAYSEKGMKEEAESDYNQAVRAEPEKFDKFIDQGGLEALFAEDESSYQEKAAAHIEQGIENLKSENHYEAVECFTQAIDLLPNAPDPYIHRGRTYVKLGQPDEAMVDLNRAAIFDPLNPVLYYWRAMAWKAMGSPINMIADLKLSCELGYGPACVEYENNKPQKH